MSNKRIKAYQTTVGRPASEKEKMNIKGEDATIPPEREMLERRVKELWVLGKMIGNPVNSKKIANDISTIKIVDEIRLRLFLIRENIKEKLSKLSFVFGSEALSSHNIIICLDKLTRSERESKLTELERKCLTLQKCLSKPVEEQLEEQRKCRIEEITEIINQKEKFIQKLDEQILQNQLYMKDCRGRANLTCNQDSVCSFCESCQDSINNFNTHKSKIISKLKCKLLMLKQPFSIPLKVAIDRKERAIKKRSQWIKELLEIIVSLKEYMKKTSPLFNDLKEAHLWIKEEIKKHVGDDYKQVENYILGKINQEHEEPTDLFPYYIRLEPIKVWLPSIEEKEVIEQKYENLYLHFNQYKLLELWRPANNRPNYLPNEVYYPAHSEALRLLSEFAGRLANYSRCWSLGQATCYILIGGDPPPLHSMRFWTEQTPGKGLLGVIELFGVPVHGEWREMYKLLREKTERHNKKNFSSLDQEMIDFVETTKGLSKKAQLELWNKENPKRAYKTLKTFRQAFKKVSEREKTVL